MYQIIVTESNSIVTVYLDEKDTKFDAIEAAAKALAREVIKNESRNKFDNNR